MLKVDESTVLTGSSDGLIRVVSLMPNRLLGVVGDMCGSDETNFEVAAHEGLAY